MRKPKLAIVGHGRSGKDTAAEWLRDHTPLVYSRSTSSVILPYIVAEKYRIPIEECTDKEHHYLFEVEWNNRHYHRRAWYDMGVKLRRSDPAFLARTALAQGQDIVVGIRDGVEIQTTRSEGLVDLVIWIDRDVPPDPTLTYGVEQADIVIPNRWGLHEFHQRLERLARSLGLPRSLDGWPEGLEFRAVLDGADGCRKHDPCRGRPPHPIQDAHDFLESGG